MGTLSGEYWGPVGVVPPSHLPTEQTAAAAGCSHAESPQQGTFPSILPVLLAAPPQPRPLPVAGGGRGRAGQGSEWSGPVPGWPCCTGPSPAHPRQPSGVIHPGGCGLSAHCQSRDSTGLTGVMYVGVWGRGGKGSYMTPLVGVCECLSASHVTPVGLS